SRRRHTSFSRDWSSDVCSSDLHLSELDLQLAVSALRPLREDVEDELGAVDDLQIGQAGDRSRLRPRQVVVEDQHLDVELHRPDDELVDLAAAEDVLRVDAVTDLQDGVEDLDAGRARELGELSEALLRLAGALFVGDVHENREI